jgi:hypothetical protein
MVAISCFYRSCNPTPIKIIFIQFERFVKVMFYDKIVILTYEQIVSNIYLFEMFKLSLLCTEDTSRIYKNSYNETCVSTRRYLRCLEFTDTYILQEFENFSNIYQLVELDKTRNPLLAQEPKRASSAKKIRKFNKLCFNMANKIGDPYELMYEYLQLELADLNDYFIKYIEHNKNNAKIQLLTSIQHNYGRDVYLSIRKFL